MSDLFVGSGQTDILEYLRVEGYEDAIPGTVYAENRLEWGAAHWVDSAPATLRSIRTGALASGRSSITTRSQCSRIRPGWQWRSMDDNSSSLTRKTVSGMPPLFATSGTIRLRMQSSRSQRRCKSRYAPIAASCRVMLSPPTPPALFDVRVTNTDTKPVDLRLVFGPEKMPSGQQQRFTHRSWQGMTVIHRWLFATSKSQEPCPLHTYTIAGDGAETAGSAGHAAVAVRAIAEPGATVRRKFVLAWHQPDLKDSSIKHERHTYARRFGDANDVTCSVIDSHTGWLQRMIAWQSVLYRWPGYPDRCGLTSRPRPLA